jgi:hypothetical protein
MAQLSSELVEWIEASQARERWFQASDGQVRDGSKLYRKHKAEDWYQ